MNLWNMSVSGGILILVIAFVRTLFQNKLPQKTFLILWAVVLLRLLVPFSVASVCNVYSLLDQCTIIKNFKQNITNYVLNVSENRVSENEASKNRRMENSSINQEERKKGQDKKKQSYGQTMPRKRNINNFIFLYKGIYLCVMFFFLLFYFIAYIRCYREFQTSLPIKESFLQAWIKSFRVRRHVTVRQSDIIVTPITYGIFQPVILLPKKMIWAEKKQLKFVLIHEYMHICHFDALKKIILIITVCIHWFNPLVWLMYVLVNRDLEIACDENVIKYFGQESKSDYALTLVHMAERKDKWMILGNGFSKNAMEERIIAIMKKKDSKKAVVIAGVLVVGITMLFATSTAQTKGAQAEDMVQAVVEENNLVIPSQETEWSSIEQETGGIRSLPNTNYQGGLKTLKDNVYHSEEFPEYKKFGLSYDEKNGHFVYKEEIVGYFKDEFAPNTYRRFTDEDGTIGLIVERDSSGKMTAFQEKAIEKAIEQEIKENSDYLTGAIANASETIENFSSGNAQATTDTSEVNAEAIADISGITGTVSEGDDVGIPEEYKKYGLTNDDTSGAWKYHGKWVGVLYDYENYLFCNNIEKISSKDIVYIEVLRDMQGKIKSLEEISKEDMQKLCDKEGLKIS